MFCRTALGNEVVKLLMTVRLCRFLIGRNCATRSGRPFRASPGFFATQAAVKVLDIAMHIAEDFTSQGLLLPPQTRKDWRLEEPQEAHQLDEDTTYHGPEDRTFKKLGAAHSRAA